MSFPCGHRHTSQGAGEAAAPSRAKPLFFRQKSSAKNEKKIYLLNGKKTEFILSSEIKRLKSGIFTKNYWVGRVRQSNFAG